MKFSQILSRVFATTALFLLAFFAWGMDVSFHSEWPKHEEIAQNMSDVVQGKLTAVRIDMVPLASAAENEEKKKDGMGDTILKGVNAIISISYVIFTPFIALAGWLLTPDWTFGEIFGFRPILHQFWILISNVVYVVFAFLLVGIAFMNIFGGESSGWQIKKKLPKLIIGIISVPFTWFLVSALVSISSVLTASILQLPYEMLKDSPAASMTFKVPKKCVIDFNKTTKDSNSADDICGKEGYDDVTITELFKSDAAYGILNVYAYGIFQIQDFKLIDKINKKSIEKVGDITVGLVISFLFFFVFLLIVVALCFALFSRAFILWVYAMFSPLFSLAYFFEGKLSLWKGWELFSISKLIALAMVPVYAAAALSFGLIFLSLARTYPLTQSSNDNVATGVGLVKKCEWDGCTSFTLGKTTITMMGVPVGMKGDLLKDAKDLSTGVLGKLIINILALIVLWAAVMAALNASDVTKAAVQPISEFGDQMGKLMRDLPKYAPIIPTAGGGKMGIEGLKGLGSSMSAEVHQRWTMGGAEMGKAFGRSFSEAIGLPANKFADAASDFTTATRDVLSRSVAWQPEHNRPLITKALSDSYGRAGITKSELVSNSAAKNDLVQSLVLGYKLDETQQRKLNPQISAIKDAKNESDLDTAIRNFAIEAKVEGSGWNETLAAINNGLKSSATATGKPADAEKPAAAPVVAPAAAAAPAPATPATPKPGAAGAGGPGT